jgi:hypothetical protein
MEQKFKEIHCSMGRDEGAENVKRKHVLGIAAGLTLGSLVLGSWASRFFAKKAPPAMGAPAVAEALLPEVISPEDQGYVDCPEETEADISEDAVQQLPASTCLSEILPWNSAPEPIHADSSLSMLEAQCGAVFADFLFYRGDGQCQWGTAMFHGTSREIQITWRNWKEKKGPRSLRFVGSDLHFENGMRPGLLLKDLAVRNGSNVSLAGFGWEDSGRHRSFQNGAFKGFDAADSRYQIQYVLDWELFDEASEAEHASIIIGDEDLDSSEPTLEKFRARVEYIEYRLMQDDLSLRTPL